jgi:hypothetical protein
LPSAITLVNLLKKHEPLPLLAPDFLVVNPSSTSNNNSNSNSNSKDF